MRKQHLVLALSTVLGALSISGCRHLSEREGPRQDIETVAQVLQQLKAKYAPDSHLAIFTVGLQSSPRGLVLTGMVESAQAKTETVASLKRAGIEAEDRVLALPDARLGELTWGLSRLSVASAREGPEHKEELGTQVLMGWPVRVLTHTTNRWWYLVQTSDGYPAWLERGTFILSTREQVSAWTNSPLLIVTTLDDRILEKPDPQAQVVSDVVLADLVKQTGERDAWYEVELPDGRAGFLPKSAAEDYAAWSCRRSPSAENIERTGRRFLGRPYLWGGNSPYGLDCSGFTKLVFFLNGIDLKRNASQQARQGLEVPLDPELSQLSKGDLLFFGARARSGRPERINHVGIYLGKKLFLHASERVQVNSLDPASPIRDEHRIRTLLKARRVLPAS